MMLAGTFTNGLLFNLNHNHKENTMEIRVAVVPGQITTVELESGATVADALRMADVSAEGFTITVNGAASGTSRALEDGDKILLTKAVKGN